MYLNKTRILIKNREISISKQGETYKIENTIRGRQRLVGVYTSIPTKADSNPASGAPVSIMDQIYRDEFRI